MFRYCNRLVAILALAITTLSATTSAPAQSRLHLAAGTAQFAANQSDFTGSGTALHLGRYTEVGNVAFTPTTTPGIFTASGWSRYTAANGAQLFAVIAGTVNFGNGQIIAIATYVGGTGRFEDASGASLLIGQMGSGGALTIQAIGRIRY